MVARLHTSDSLQPSFGNVNVNIEMFMSYDEAYAAYEEAMEKRKKTGLPHLIELQFLGGIHLTCYEGRAVETIPNSILCSVRDLCEPANCGECKKAPEATQT